MTRNGSSRSSLFPFLHGVDSREKHRRSVARSRRSREQTQARARRLALEGLEERTLLNHTPLILGGGTEPFVAVDPLNPNNVVVGSNSFAADFSTDGGANFGG